MHDVNILRISLAHIKEKTSCAEKIAVAEQQPKHCPIAAQGHTWLLFFCHGTLTTHAAVKAAASFERKQAKGERQCEWAHLIVCAHRSEGLFEGCAHVCVISCV